MRHPYRWWFLLLLPLALATPTMAAPPVEHPRGTPGGYGYAPAAAVLGADDWGDQGHSETTTHVLLSGTRDTAALWIALPPDTSEDAASRWLQRLSEQLNWAHPLLSLYTRSGALVLKVESSVSPTALSAEQSRLRLDLPQLAREVSKLSHNPILLAVRTPGARVTQRQPEPYVSGVRRGDTFLFYRVPASGGKTLQVDYGVPRRWPAAALISLLLWLVFPLLPALAALYFVHFSPDRKPEERIRVFDRCQLVGRWVAAVGFYVTLSALNMERTRYFGFNPWIGIPPALTLLLPYWFWCGGMIGLVRQRLSRPIASAGLVVRNNPVLEFGLVLVLSAIVLGPGLVTSQLGPRAGLLTIPIVTAAAMALIGVLMLGIFAPRLLRKAPRILEIKFESLPENPELLRVVLRERAEEISRHVEGSVPNAKLTAARAEAVAASLVAQTVLSLDADQQVALCAAYHLVQRRVLPLHRTQCTVFLGSLIILIVVSLWSCFHPLPGMGGVLLPLSFSLLLGGGKYVTTFVDHRITRHFLAADLRIARALEHPQRFLEALRLLEQAEDAAHATAGTGKTAGTGFAERRNSLEQFLGLG